MSIADPRSPIPDRRLPIVLALLFLLSLPLVTTRIYASDEVQFFAWIRSWAFDRDVDFENEYRHFQAGDAGRYKLFSDTLLGLVNENNRRVNFAPIGCAVLWSPFYAAGHVVARVTGAPADGYSQPYVSAVAYGSAFYGFLAVLLSADIARRTVGRGALAAAVIAIGTPLVYYIYISPPFSHATSAFAVSLFIWTWLRVRHAWTPRAMVALGATGALMAMVREQDVFFVIGPALDYMRALVVTVRAEPANSRARLAGGGLVLAAIGAAAFVLVYSPQLLAYQALNGHPSQTTLVTRKLTWTSPHALEVLFSPQNGLFAWTPLAAIAIAGLVWLAIGGDRRAKALRLRTEGMPPEGAADAGWIGICALVMVAGQIYISGAVESWTVAGSFGQRRFVALTPLLTLGLAAVLAAVQPGLPTRPPSGRQIATRVAVVVTLGLCIWWNVGLIAQFGLHRMDRQRLSLGHNARQTFIELPREAPAIVYRYLTDRESFYRLPRH